MATSRKILIGVDDTEECCKAFAWVVTNFIRPGDEIHFLHVVPRIHAPVMYGMWLTKPHGTEIVDQGLTLIRWSTSDTPHDLTPLHTIPGAPAVDLAIQEEKANEEKLIAHAEDFIRQRFLTLLPSPSPPPVIHIVKSETDTDSIGV